MKLHKTLKHSLSSANTSWQLVLLGIAVGCIAAIAAVAMRLSYEHIQLLFKLGSHDEFTPDGQWLRAIAPLMGALVILFIAFISHQKYHRMGVPFVLHRQRKFYGFIPVRNTINQFFSAIAALASGFSVGKEGPAVHVGAGSASFLSQQLNLPNNASRILTACGIAAGISATFNAPLAAAVFVFEVVLLQFRIHLFLPIMASSLVGSAISQYFFGDSHAYAHIDSVDIQLYSVAPLIILGVIVGVVSTCFNRSLIGIMKASASVHMAIRLPLAGIIVGLIAWFIPHVVGTEHGALTIAFSENPEFTFIAMIFIGKFIATVFALGLGIPGGVIGVLYGLGALLGAVITWAMVPYFPQLAPMAVIICMVAFMAASLNAPMAALVAMLEMSEQASIIFPSLLVIVPAILITQQVFGLKSLFLHQLDSQGLEYKTSMVTDTLQETGVLALIRRKFICINHLSQMHNTYLSIPTFIQPDSQVPVFTFQGSSDVLPVLTDNDTIAQAYDEIQSTKLNYVLIMDSQSQQLIGFITKRVLLKHLHAEFD